MTKTITVNVDEEVARKFRRLAGTVYGRRKGYLGKAVNNALKVWITEKESSDAAAEALELLEKGIKVKKVWGFNREELYEDRISQR